MDAVINSGALVVHVNMIQTLALAVVTYYLGVWIRSKVSILERLSIPSPVIGGMTLAIVLSVLQAYQVLIVQFDSTLQTLLMLAFFTTIGLMASLKVVKQGGILLLFFLIAVSVLAVLQNVLGMSIASDWVLQRPLVPILKRPMVFKEERRLRLHQPLSVWQAL